MVKIHSEVDAHFETLGNLYLDGEKLVCGDTDVVKRFVALVGIAEGGRQFGVIEMTFRKATLEHTTSDPTEGGAFAE